MSLQEALQESLAVSVNQLEIFSKRLELEAKFERNLRSLEINAPDLWEKFANYVPKEFELVLEPEGYVDVINLRNNQKVYNEDPFLTAADHLQQFLSEPTSFCLTPVAAADSPASYFHAQIMNRIQPELAGSVNLTDIKERSVGHMVMVGLGLGTCVQKFLDELTIDNLTIYESQEDLFFASLFVVNWDKIIEHFSAPNRNLNLLLGITGKSASRLAKIGTSVYGPHLNAIGFTFVHSLGGNERAFITEFTSSANHLGTGHGFLLDEQVSYAHSLANHKNSVKLLRFSEVKRQGPVLLVGNGPSLDQQEAFIREAQDKAIVVSCGTALSWLSKKGIKPDIHIEMERMRLVKDWIDEETTQEFRKGILCIGFNVVHPEVFELFDQSAMVIKGNDTGAEFLKQSLSDQRIMEPLFSNPSVTNLGFSIMLSLGFREIYLMGVDCGALDPSTHHAKASAYFDESARELRQKNRFVNDGFEVPGNLREKVLTTPVFNESRINIEHLISLLPDLKVYNPNDGAKIDNAITVSPSDLKLRSDLLEEKAALISQILEDSSFRFKEASDSKRLFESYFKFMDRLYFPREFEGKEALYQRIMAVYSEVRQLEKDDVFVFRLIRGEVINILMLFYRFCLWLSEEDCIRNYEVIQEAMLDLLEKGRSLIAHNAETLSELAR